MEGEQLHLLVGCGGAAVQEEEGQLALQEVCPVSGVQTGGRHLARSLDVAGLTHSHALRAGRSNINIFELFFKF